MWNATLNKGECIIIYLLSLLSEGPSQSTVVMSQRGGWCFLVEQSSKSPGTNRICFYWVMGFVCHPASQFCDNLQTFLAPCTAGFQGDSHKEMMAYFILFSEAVGSAFRLLVAMRKQVKKWRRCSIL